MTDIRRLRDALSPLRLAFLLAWLAPSGTAQAAFTPDAEYSAQAGLATIKASAAYSLGITGAGSLVGVIDSGINPAHQEFLGAISDGFNYFQGGPLLSDSSGIAHGSHVAGVIAARRDGSGMLGVAWEAGLVIGATDYSLDQLGYAVNFAVSRDVDVLNNSWGITGATILDYDRAAVESSFTGVLAALQSAVASDTVVVFANGNEGFTQPQVFGGLPYLFPELERSWITVVAASISGSGIPTYANRCGVAVKWCLAAPGGFSGDLGVYSADGATTAGYKYLKGSSNAAPFASGAIALLAQRFSYMTAEQLAAVLLTTATRGTEAVLSPIFGRGLIDLDKAMKGPAALEFTFDVDTQGQDSVWSNNISGSGSLIKRGEGTLLLTGSNSFSGGVTLADGSLGIGSDANLGAGSSGLVFDGGTLLATADLSLGRAVTVASGGGILDTATHQVTVSAALQGDGLLAKEGSGTLVLSGSSPFAGTTWVRAGTLQATSDSLGGDVINAATLLFDQDTDGSFGGEVSGTGVLRKRGSGVLTMSGSNSYSGGTFVESGTLAGSSDSLQGNIGNDASVVFEQASNGTYAGVMEGSGALVKRGEGALWLTGANAYSGGSVIEAGRLIGSDDSLQGRFSGSGTLVADQSGEGIFGGQLDGIAFFEKQGTGQLHLTGSTHQAGLTTILDGILRLEGALASDLVVGGTGIFVAAGMLDGDVAVADGGVLEADTAVAAAISGSLALASGAGLALRLTVMPGNALAVGGDISLAGGRLLVEADGSHAALSRQVVLTAGGTVGGRLDAVTVDQSALRGFLDYGVDEVGLVLARVDNALAAQAAGANQAQVALGLRRLLASGYYTDAFAAQVNALYAAPAYSVRRSLGMLSGELVADAMPAVVNLLGQAALAPLLRRPGGDESARKGALQSALGGSGVLDAFPGLGGGETGAWVQTTSLRSRAASTPDAGGYRFSQQLLAAGVDAGVDEASRIGLMFAQGGLDLHREGGADALDGMLSVVGLYGRQERGALQYFGSLQVGRIEADRLRWVNGGGLTTKAVSRSRQDSLLAVAGMSATLPALPLGLHPVVLLQWLQIDSQAARETGSGAFNLTYPAARNTFSGSLAGLEWRAAESFLPPGLGADLSLLWQHDFTGTGEYEQQAAFTVAPASGFSVRPAGVARDKVQLQAGLAYASPGNWRSALRGSAEAGRGISGAGLALEFDYRW